MWSWSFDIIIFTFLIGGGAFLIEVVTDWPRYKRHSFVLGIIGALAVGWVTIFYGSFIEPRLLVVREEAIELNDDAQTQIRVGIVADFHVGPYKKSDWVKYVVDELMAESPEMILIPGDFIFNSDQDIEYLAPLSGLSAPLGVYAVMGNHDYSHGADPAVIQAVKDAGITMLDNESVTVDIDGRSLVIAGLADLWFAADVAPTVEGLKDDQHVILLSHNPDIVLDDRVAVADLVVSGHTHGGQIRLPLIGPVPPLPTKLGRAFDQGLFQYSDTQQLFITSGVGETGPRARLFNPPELNLITLSF